MSSIVYRQYTGESDLPHIMALVQHELSEPYVIYTYRYFLHQWPHLSFLAYPDHSSDPVGVIVCKQSMHKDITNRGYIAMLSVHKNWRKRGIASTLVRRTLEVMKLNGVEEVVLETEFDNSAALSLYESLGFIKEKRLYRFYLNGKDAFRLVLVVPPPSDVDDEDDPEARTRGTKPLYILPARTVTIPPLPYDPDDEVSSR
ncbi:acyl-CoA N-acyltransferase [Sparassis latifolia]|uniref:N-alpha-acetyltransferase 30 n=1 Tax=Sparassis crispa TaxID=139825 RepID=A0A401GY07_9APHY|nr:N-alpha-acetyltransferase 30 [Sparassis crispa]GBE87108.1 N-alpha-acetyltransferase 30 [Sparassis crispa]